MRFALLTLLALMIPPIVAAGSGLAQSGGERTSVSYSEEKAGGESTKPSPNPLRSICAIEWNAYYKSRNMGIEVSTRGTDSETVVFVCTLCSLEDHFIKPFLYTEYDGKRGIDRIRECGFTKVVFKGGRGINEIVIDVPDELKP
jgi:hypothetical protein